MPSCSRTPRKNIYNKKAIEDLCLQESKFPENQTCTYSTYDYCRFTLAEPIGVIIPFDLNRFVLECNNGSTYSDDSHSELYYATRENCICMAFGKYIGYFNKNCPWLDCLCFPFQEDQLNDHIQKSSNKKECIGLHRRSCKAYYHDEKKTVGTCKTKKQPFKFEEIIECPDNNNLRIIKETNDGNIIELMKDLFLPSYLKNIVFFSSSDNISPISYNPFSSISEAPVCHKCEISTQDLATLTFIISTFYFAFIFIFFMCGFHQSKLGRKILKQNNDYHVLDNEGIAEEAMEKKDIWE